MGSIDRRELLKLSSASLAALVSSAAADAAPTAVLHSSVPMWEVFEVSLPGPSSRNPFVEVQLTASFSLGNRAVQVDGFYDGSGTYKIRFMPDAAGNWSYITSSNVAVLANKSGSFACTAALPNAHGPVRVRNTRHFAYADETPFFPFGTTCYAWVHQSQQLQQQTLETLRSAPFNKIRMCVFPKSYEYNHNEPALYPFERDASGKNDFTRPVPAFFAHIEQRIGELRALGIEADLILFHPYDRWGYASMTAEADDRYLRYVLARMSAYRNIWWSLANEWDFMHAKSAQDFDRFFHIVEQHDATGHLRSIHYGNTMYDYSRPWVTHASLQTFAFEQAANWRNSWSKPICFDEVQYEGNLNSNWGNLSGPEMMRRFWLGVIAGGYVTHGETYLDADAAMDENTTPTIWWSHGGRLHGSSPARIAFLRKILENSATASGNRTGFNAQISTSYLNAATQDESGNIREILYFFDYHQPIYYQFSLPPGSYTAEQIDPWEMKATPIAGTFTGRSKIRLSGTPYQAIRFRRV